MIARKMADEQEPTTQTDQSCAIARYMTLLADQEKDQDAIDALVQIGAPAVPALMAAIRECDRWYAAATALARIGTPAIPPLIDLLQQAPFSNFAFHALTEMGTLAVPCFITALAHPNDKVRMWAATAFTCLPDIRARDPLLAALADPDTRQNIASRSRTSCRWLSACHPIDDGPTKRRETLQALGKHLATTHL